MPMPLQEKKVVVSKRTVDAYAEYAKTCFELFRRSCEEMVYAQ